MYIYIYVYVYIFIYVYIYTYMYIYIYYFWNIWKKPISESLVLFQGFRFLLGENKIR